MRALLVVNPAATTTKDQTRGQIEQALAAQLDLQVAITNHRGHASELAAQAVAAGTELVITLGGDGTVNEVINGLLGTPHHPSPESLPILGTLPGGSANVFPRALGLPIDPLAATDALLAAVSADRTRLIGLGLATYRPAAKPEQLQRWFAFNAGVGIDAEIIAAMERQRAKGATATPQRYLMTAIRQYFAHTDRSAAALTVRRPGVPAVAGVHFALIQNTSPWTFFGPVRLDPCPRASFDTGLDVFAPRSLAVLPSLHHVRRMFVRALEPVTRSGLLALHDQSELLITADRPMALQLDGDGCGLVYQVRFQSQPNALRVLT